MATALKIGRRTLRRIAAAVALAMLVASVPAVGVTLMPNRSGGPCFTLNICHPMQSLGGAPGTVAIARPAAPQLFSSAALSEPATEPVAVSVAKFVSSPDPPPPKPFA
ncbi:MAG: hypothetical protein ACREQI_10045 [Candidatus Binataceae bacterium]